MDKYILLGILTYCPYVLGLFFPMVSGLSLFPVLVCIILLALSKNIFVNKKLFLYCFLFISAYVFSYLYFYQIDYYDYQNYKVSMLIVKMIPFILIPCLLKSNHIPKFIYGMWIILLLFLLVVFIMSLPNIASIGINTRIEFGVFNPIWISRAILECLLLAILIYNVRRIKLLLLGIISMVVIYASGSKGPILSFVIIFIMWRFAQIQIRKTKLLFSIGVLLLLLGGIALVVYLPQDSYLFQRFFTAVPDGASQDIIEHSRIVVWPNSIQYIYNQGWTSLLFGNGPGSFPTFYFGQASDIRMYPHNIILELLIENGLIILSLTIIIFIYFYNKSQSNFKYLFLFYIANSFFSGDLLLNEYIFLYLSLMIVGGRSYQTPNQEKFHTNLNDKLLNEYTILNV